MEIGGKKGRDKPEKAGKNTGKTTCREKNKTFKDYLIIIILYLP